MSNFEKPGRWMEPHVMTEDVRQHSRNTGVRFAQELFQSSEQPAKEWVRGQYDRDQLRARPGEELYAQCVEELEKAAEEHWAELYNRSRWAGVTLRD